MRIDESLELRGEETIAFVGGGGKTTLMFRLADELAGRGRTVVTSTTTRLAAKEASLAPYCLACACAEEMLAELPSALSQANHVLAVGCVIPESDRVDGLPFETLRCIAALPEVDHLLIEADGSRERPFKAPGAHEPAMPEWATLVIPVVGLDVLGRGLNSDRVHRPEIVAELAGCSPDATVTPALVATVTGHRHGGCKNVPAGARVVPFLNKADSLARLDDAYEIAGYLITVEMVERVLIGTAAGTDPVWDCVHRTAARAASL